jgi:D-alanyl-lipoteichoic acid acyltransferase DltB (MBOAT superfamily)
MKGKFADGVRIVRTFILVCIGDLFFRADSVPHALRMLGESVRVFNPQIFVDGSLLGLGLDFIEWGILIVSLIVLLLVSVTQYRLEAGGSGRNVRDIIADKKMVIRWIIYIGLFFYVILLAEYGPGYSAAEFIYKDF